MIISIDFGTKYSKMSVWRDNLIEIIPTNAGDKLISTLVSFPDFETTIIGNSAKDSLITHATNTIFNIKRLIGRKYSDTTFQHEIKQYPFKIVPNEEDELQIQIEHNENIKKYSIEEIIGMLLQNFKATAEEYLQTPINRFVVTVPNYFNDIQRITMKNAGNFAGIDVVRVINDHSAAGIAYGLHEFNGEKKIVVIHMGEFQFEVSITLVDYGIFEVISSSVDHYFGGINFNNRLVDYIINEYNNNSNFDIKNDKKVIERLRREIEIAKIDLSSTLSTSLHIPSFIQGESDFIFTITRSLFESLNEDHFQKSILIIDKLLKDSNHKKEDFSHVIFIGGAIKIPKLQESFINYFKGIDILNSIDTSEVVAIGAASLAARLCGNSLSKNEFICVLEPLLFDIGIEIEGGIMETILFRSTLIPVMKTRIFYPKIDNQKGITIKLFEGQRKMTKDNHFLGSFNFELLSNEGKKGKNEIEISLEIKDYSLVTVCVKEKNLNHKMEVKIAIDENRFGVEEIERLLEESKKFCDDDRAKYLSFFTGFYLDYFPENQ